jgi:hypothetical protein
MAQRLQDASVTRPMSTSQPAKSTQWQQPSTTCEPPERHRLILA